MVLSPTNPTAKTALNARVSGAREPVRFQWMKNGQILDGEETSSLGADYLAKGDTVEVEAVSGSLSVSETIVIQNSPPSISAVQFNYGSVFTVDPKGEDRDGDAIGYRYQWLVNDEELPFESENILPGKFFSKGDRVTVAITPYDEESDGAAAKVKDVLIENKPPEITSTPPVESSGEEFVYAITAEDPEGEPLTYSLETAPDGMVVDPQSGEVRWSMRAEVAGSQQVRIKVEDASGRWSIQEFFLNTQEKAGN